MKTMKKTVTALLAAILCLLSLTALVGCGNDTYCIEWQLDSYTLGGTEYSTQFNEMDYFEPVARDRVKFELREDKTYSFTDCSGVLHEGRYETEKIRRTKLSIFSTGTQIKLYSGNFCITSFDYKSNRINFSYGGVYYYFVRSLNRTWGGVLAEGLAREGERLQGFEEGGEKDYDGLFRGEVTEEDGAWFLSLYNDYGEIRHYALDKCTAYFYNYDAQYAITAGEMREGACAVKYDVSPSSRRFAIHYKAE